MNPRSLNTARLVCVAGLVAAVAYLTWRIGWSLGGTPLMLAVPALALEVAALIGSAVLVWALWPGTEPRSTVAQRATSPADPAWTGAVDIVVRVDDQVISDLRATLLACRTVEGAAAVSVLSVSGRPEVRELADELGVVWHPAETGDSNGLRTAALMHEAPSFLLLDAGDVPSVDAIERLRAHGVRSTIAVIQGRCEVFGGDLTESNPDGRHELTFERRALNPALGRRGCAVFADSGALVRRDALARVPIDNANAVAAQWQTSVELMRAGWEIVAPAGCIVIGRQAARDLATISVDRVRRTAAARAVVSGPRGVCRVRGLTFAQRAAFVAWTVWAAASADVRDADRRTAWQQGAIHHQPDDRGHGVASVLRARRCRSGHAQRKRAPCR
jgi:hypothetical protein